MCRSELKSQGVNKNGYLLNTRPKYVYMPKIKSVSVKNKYKLCKNELKSQCANKLWVSA